MYFQIMWYFFVITTKTNSIWAAQILGVLNVPMYSHYKIMDTILKELAARGHEVTSITPFKELTPVANFKSVELTGSIERFAEVRKQVFVTGPNGLFTSYQLYETLGVNVTEETLAHKNVQNLLKSDQEFDLVLIDQCFNEALKGFCHHYNAPCVSINTMAASRWSNQQMGNPATPSYISGVLVGYTGNMSFIERFYNFVLYILEQMYQHAYILPKHNELLQIYFTKAPHIYDIFYNVSLLLVNSHSSLGAAVPYLPNVIDIGGSHVALPKKLPKELQDILDSAKSGAIYFSLGSNMKMSSLPLETTAGILKIFSKLQLKVLWKSDNETLPGQPKNVMLKKWLPQNDILAHPNVKLFVTHGGQLSTIETTYHGVPILGLPIFGDQELNVAHAVQNGYGVSLPLQKFNLKKFEDALKEILNNPIYSENAKKVSKIFHDRPMKPLDAAIYWIEYVLRHRGAYHLRTASLNLTWYQYLLLDVVGMILVAVISVTVLISIVANLFAKKAKDNLKKQN